MSSCTNQKILPNVLIACFYNGESLRDHLIRASFAILKKTLCIEPRAGKNCQVCQFVVKRDTLAQKLQMKLSRLIKVHETVILGK